MDTLHTMEEAGKKANNIRVEKMSGKCIVHLISLCARLTLVYMWVGILMNLAVFIESMV